MFVLKLLFPLETLNYYLNNFNKLNYINLHIILTVSDYKICNIFKLSAI